MHLNLTKEEAKHLHDLRTTLQQAQRDFTVAFTMTLAARGISEATFMGLAGDELLVQVPTQPVVD